MSAVAAAEEPQRCGGHPTLDEAMACPICSALRWVRPILAEVERLPVEALLAVDPAPSCHPHQIHVNIRAHKVACSKCGRVFAPFEALALISRTWAQYAANREALQREIQSLTQVRDEVQRQVRAAKDALRRAEERAAKKGIQT